MSNFVSLHVYVLLLYFLRRVSSGVQFPRATSGEHSRGYENTLEQVQENYFSDVEYIKLPENREYKKSHRCRD